MDYKFTDKIVIDFILKENNEKDKYFVADLVIKNNLDYSIEKWKLCYDHFRPSETWPVQLCGDSLLKAEYIKNIGEYNELLGLEQIPANSELKLTIKGNWVIRKLLDTPSCYFFVIDNENVFSVTGEADITIAKPKIFNQKIPADKIFTGDKVRLIPVPEKVDLIEGSCDFLKINSMYNECCSKEAADVFITAKEHFLPIFNTDIKLSENKTEFSLILREDKKIPLDGYELAVSPENIVLTASSKGGWLYGIISILKLADSYDNKIPCMKIEDKPRFAYRGNLFDIARNFRTVSEMKKYLVLLALNKVNVLHCRMTDDEGWRLEIKKYPNIAEVGGFRGYEEVMPPFHGSGPERFGGYYTQKDMSEIIDHANSLNITFLPEIVIPSHSRALIMSFTNYKGLENSLIEAPDKSEYKTAQNFTDNILNPGLDFTYTVVENIYKEVADLFKIQQTRKMPFSDYIHVGVDEVPEGAWMKSPACRLLMEKYGLKTTDEIQFYFIVKMQKFIKTLGYKIAGWEEIVNGGTTLDKDVIVYSWKGEKAGFEAAENDFPVVMCPVQYLYFDLAYTPEHHEPGLYWGGYNNPEIIYSYYPLECDTSEKVKNKVIGIQSCLWSENLGYPRRTNMKQLPEKYINCPYEYMAFPKMTAFSEAAWSFSENRNWSYFKERFEFEKKILEKFKVSFRNIPI